jgi:hypothetical protein
MPRDTGAITLLILAAALAVGVLGVSERVQSHPNAHSPSQTLHYADLRESLE